MQNLITLVFTDQDLADIDAALATLRRVSAPFVALEPQERRELNKLGPKSEAFVDETLTVLQNNPQIIPPNLGLDEALADKAALDQLRPRLQQLRQLVERADDTEMALGSDVLNVALEGYRLLAVSGKGESLKSARRALSRRFSRSRREPEPEPEVATVE